VIAPSSNATIENDITKPSAIIAGRTLPAWPTDAPRRIGSIGSVQGAATVTTPASSARTRVSIECVHHRSRRNHCRAYDDLRGDAAGRYSSGNSGSVTSL